MTSKFSLISVVVGAALLLAVPAAWGKGQLRPVVTPEAMHEDGFDTAVAAQQAIWMAEDGFDRAVAAKLALQSPGPRPSDSVDGARFSGTQLQGTKSGVPTRRSDSADSAFVAGRRAEVGSIRYSDSADGAIVGSRLETPTVSATSSGTEIEWPQVGVGLGIGILLALGLGLIMRVAHVRPFAH